MIRAVLCVACLTAIPGFASDILTAQHDANRTSWNSAETLLTTANVKQTTFGKLFSRPLDGWVYAQPLYMQGLNIPGQGIGNVVFVCTANNTVYAFDADNASIATPYWSTNLGPADTTPNGPGSPNSEPVLGIISTPVIVPSTQALYVLAATRENGHRVYRLHALNVATGQEQFGGPVIISGQVAGNSWDSVNGMVSFNADFHLVRASLAATADTVFLETCGSHDIQPYHAWIFGYSVTTLQQTSILNLTANGQAGGIWQSTAAPAVDANGSLYLETGNGDFDGTANFSDSFVKLATSPGLNLTDWFAVSNFQTLNAYDMDLSAAGPLMVPGSKYVIGSGKPGVIYVLDSTNMGHLQTGDGQIVQSFNVAPHCAPDFSSGCDTVQNLIFWNNSSTPTLFVWPWGGGLTAYGWTGGQLVTTPSAAGSMPANYPGGFLFGSSNGNAAGTGIVWALTGDDGSVSGNGAQLATLRAFDASNITKELWNSNQNPARDGLGYYAKFLAPVVANGKVYAGTFSNQLVVYGAINPLVSIAVTPANPSIAKGLTEQFAAIGTYANNSTQDLTGSVTWSSGTTASATISATGLATGAGTGTSTITATLTGVSGSTVLTVTAPSLQSMVVTPANPSVVVLTTQQLVATGTYSDGSTNDLSALAMWSSQGADATVTGTGLAAAVAVGSAGIAAAVGSVSGGTLLTVLPLGPCAVSQPGLITVVSAQSVVNQAMGRAQAINDLDGDKAVGAVDIQLILNTILNVGCGQQ
jgi:hypothetical protein